jgi:methylenetetrahydrofolate dehydrogenase (NADP+)/methenyltetrahydrofolate cyclohydrolase
LHPEAPPPQLVVVLVGENPASLVYVNKKAKVAAQLGMASRVLRLPAGETDEARLFAALDTLNADPTVHGILVQMPLPAPLDAQRVLARVAPEKDVDGFHPVNMGRLMAGDLPVALPCTPAGILRLLADYHIPLAGRHAVVVGRSNIVGKPLALLLLHAHATVTVCHSQTQALDTLTRQADILVAAIGKPQWIGPGHVKPGAVVVDVGINRLPPAPGQTKGPLVGDVDFEAVSQVASALTPVPGGVGPMTIGTLMENTLALYLHQMPELAASLAVAP